MPDLQVRLGLYRRLSAVESHEAIEAFAAELIDRFGPLPEEVRHLLDIVEIKGLCRAGRHRADRRRAQGRGHRLPQQELRQSRRAHRLHPRGRQQVKLQPDHRLIYYANWETPEARLAGARDLLKRLVKIAQAVKQAA